jgi:hypothetical protein
MQHEPPIGLDRSSLQHRLAANRRRRRGHFQLFEDVGQFHLQRAVDDDAQRAVGVVLPDEGHGLGEVRVRHGGHGDQELVGEEVLAGHGRQYPIPLPPAQAI